MRLVVPLLAVATALACAPRVPIEGAPCACPSGYHCDLMNRCVKGAGPAPMMQPGPMAMGPAATPPPDASPPLTTCSNPGPSPVRRLTAEEYRNTVLDLTGVLLPETDVPTEFSRLRAVLGPRIPVSPGALEMLVLAAEEVSEQAVGRLFDLVPCEPDAPGSDACARTFIAGFGARAFRRPLAGDEQTTLLKAFEAGRSAAALTERLRFAEGIRRVIEVALGSPQFLYRIDLGEPSQRSGITPLTPWEVATRLSYLLWVSMPDEELRAAAASGKLASKQDVIDQAQRMLRDQRSLRTRDSFLERWLEISAARLAPKPPEAATFTVELREALVTSARLTFSRQAWEGDQTLLFESPELWADPGMARFYGLAAPPGVGWGLVKPTGDQKRFGILTYPALLSSLARGEETSPVARGVLFVEEVLCTELPEPPPNISAVAPAEQRPGATMRERLSEHVDNPACASCHQLFDPVGLGLENYDGYGAWRTHEGGQPINAAGKLLGTDFNGPDGLARLLGGNDQVSDCLVIQWFRYTFGRDPQPTDMCTLQQMKSAFMRNGRSLQSLLLATIETDAFRTRNVASGGAP